MPVKVSGFTSEKWDQFLHPNIKTQHIAVSERALISAVEKGFDNKPVVITDGRPRRDYHDVKPFGVIEFARTPSMVDAVMWILGELQKRSPVGPGRNGHYKDRHVVMIEGQNVRGDIRTALLGVKPGQRVQIVNIQPYAKKLEGVASKKKKKLKGKRGVSKQARAGIYRPVQRLAVQRFGRSLFIDFKMVKLELDGAQRRTKTGLISANYTYPSIQLYIKPTS